MTLTTLLLVLVAVLVLDAARAAYRVARPKRKPQPEVPFSRGARAYGADGDHWTWVIDPAHGRFTIIDPNGAVLAHTPTRGSRHFACECGCATKRQPARGAHMWALTEAIRHDYRPAIAQMLMEKCKLSPSQVDGMHETLDTFCDSLQDFVTRYDPRRIA